MIRRLIGLGVTFGLLVGADLGTRSFVNTKVDQRAQAEAPPGSSVDADVGGFPFLPPLLLNGEVSHADVHLENIKTGVLVFARVDLKLRGVILDRSVLFNDRKARITDIRTGVVSAEITQDTISNIIRVPVSMREGKVLLTVLNQEVEVTPQISADGQLSFRGNALTRVFSLKIPQTDYVPCVGEVEILAGRMRLSCEIDEVPPMLLDAVQNAAG